jgi:putative ribosome biogenesis GTPase RsgA
MESQMSDLEQLRNLLSKAEKGLYPMNKALQLFGDTGAGKSTMTNILAGRKLESVQKAIKQL